MTYLSDLNVRFTDIWMFKKFLQINVINDFSQSLNIDAI